MALRRKLRLTLYVWDKGCTVMLHDRDVDGPEDHGRTVLQIQDLRPDSTPVQVLEALLEAYREQS